MTNHNQNLVTYVIRKENEEFFKTHFMGRQSRILNAFINNLALAVENNPNAPEFAVRVVVKNLRPSS